MLPDFLRSLAPKLKYQTELRAHESKWQYVDFTNGNLTSNTRRVTGGVSSRIYKGGFYGFASASDVSEEAALRTLREAEEKVLFLDSRLKRGDPPLPAAARKEFYIPHTVREAQQDRLIGFARELDEFIGRKYPDLLSRSVSVRCVSEEKALVTGDASSGHLFYPMCHVYIEMMAEGPSGRADLTESIGGAGYFDDFFTTPEALEEKIDKLYRSLRLKTEGVYPNAGLCDVVLDSSLAGILAHEAVGHTVEADWARTSVATPNLGKKVASELVSLTDFAHTAFGETLGQPVYMDEEGIPGRDAEIIKDGILVGLMHDRESAAEMGVLPTGNARAQYFYDEPLIRMRNTCIHPGKSSLEEMIASVDDGYYLVKDVNGQADTTGEFMFVISEGYEIKKGKLGKAILGATISGFAFEMLKTVDMVGSKLSWNTSGMCGKKQQMAVTMGGPAIKAKIKIGGR